MQIITALLDSSLKYVRLEIVFEKITVSTCSKPRPRRDTVSLPANIQFDRIHSSTAFCRWVVKVGNMLLRAHPFLSKSGSVRKARDPTYPPFPLSRLPTPPINQPAGPGCGLSSLFTVINSAIQQISQLIREIQLHAVLAPASLPSPESLVWPYMPVPVWILKTKTIL